MSDVQASDESEAEVIDDAREPAAEAAVPEPKLADDGPDGDLDEPDDELFGAWVQSAVALLFASPEPLTLGRLSELLELKPDDEPVEEEMSEPKADPGEFDAELEAELGADAASEEAQPASKQPTGKKRGRKKRGPRPTRAAVKRVLEEAQRRFDEAQLPITLREIGGGFRLYTDERLGEIVARLDRSRRVERISQAALETLAIIGYRQPVTKAEIEAIRGVQAGPVLRQLVDRGLAKVTGRADQPGSPLLYGTTKDFLDKFGLARIEDLPRDGELARD